MKKNIKIKINVNENLKKLAKIFESQSKLYIVGGFVRDSLMNRNCCDIDLASSVETKNLATLLKGTDFKIVDKNNSLGAIKITDGKNSYDYTTFRKEEYKNGKHFPEKVDFVKSIEEDVKRRDFTINAIYYDINSEEVVDPLNGLDDIEKKQLRVVSKDTLKFDGERILRLVKYSCLLNCKIEKETLIIAKENCKNVYYLSSNMIKSYKDFFENLSWIKKLKAKRLLAKIGIKKFF